MKGVASHLTLSVAQYHTGCEAYLGVVSYPLLHQHVHTQKNIHIYMYTYVFFNHNMYNYKNFESAFPKKNNLNISGSNMKGVASHSTLSVAQYHTGCEAYLRGVIYPLRSCNELDTFEHYNK